MKMISILACAMLAGSMASAQPAATTPHDNGVTDKTTTSKTLMGATETKHVHTEKMKDAAGNEANVKVTETKKVSKDGKKMKKSVKMDAEGTQTK